MILVKTTLGSLATLVRGQGDRTLVLWPSVFTDHHIFERLADGLEDRYRIILIDGPGHGQSGGPEASFSMAQCATAMLEVMDYHGVEVASVGGVSWGGMVSAHVAVMAPERVERLLLINTPMFLGDSEPALAARLIALGARWMPGSTLFRKGVAGSFFSDKALAANPSYAKAFNAMLKRAKPRALGAAIRSVMLESEPVAPLLPQIAAPTLVIAGENDAMYPIADLRKVSERLPKGRFETVLGKHISPIEAPDDVERLVHEFLQ
ncbi:MAG: alpha/beta hydrolase [Pseudomonadota bacterium]